MLSKKTLLAIVVPIFFYISQISEAQQSDKCVAIVTGLSGDVLIKRAGDSGFLKTSWGAQLFSGDQIKTSSKSEATLAFSNNSIIRLGMNSQITISGDEPSPGKTAGNVKMASAGMMISLSEVISKKEYAKDEGAIAGVRSVNDASPIELVSPVNTNLKSLRPSFSWSTGESYSGFVITLYNSNGPVWSRKVTKNTLSYPENEKELENGMAYFWNVEGEALIDTEKSASRRFAILTAEKSKEVAGQEEIIRSAFKDEKESSSFHSLLGAYYINQGLLLDALNEFRMVAEMNADASMPHEILGSIYSTLGNKDKAIEELKMALLLSKSREN